MDLGSAVALSGVLVTIAISGIGYLLSRAKNEGTSVQTLTQLSAQVAALEAKIDRLERTLATTREEQIRTESLLKAREETLDRLMKVLENIQGKLG